MNEDTSRLVIRVCNNMGLDVRSYSGRGMYGRSCVGVDCGNTHVTLAQIMVELQSYGEPDALEAMDHFTREGAIATDHMGMGSILYFPRLPWVNEEEYDEPAESVR